MFVILFYDVNEKRVGKMLKLCRQYLIWQQNSVFEGEISVAKLEELKIKINRLIKKSDEDSVIIYEFRSMLYSKRVILGKDKKINFDFI
ncbi:MAG: CRISPR-associated endonuclease Cas2 [Candidatus Marinimicrobia bacterium]|nr:CRISPR-associated endonuclease Cas2 [Candidatus Neomarinimicrobiota bacterium]